MPLLSQHTTPRASHPGSEAQPQWGFATSLEHCGYGNSESRCRGTRAKSIRVLLRPCSAPDVVTPHGCASHNLPPGTQRQGQVQAEILLGLTCPDMPLKAAGPSAPHPSPLASRIHPPHISGLRPFNKYLLTIDYVPGTVRDSGSKVKKKKQANKSPDLVKLVISWRRRYDIRVA